MMATDDIATTRVYDNISLGDSMGVFKLHPQGLGWRGQETSKVVNCSSQELVSLVFLRGAQFHELRVQLTSQQFLVFRGFSETDYEPMSEFCRSHGLLTLQDQSMCVHGWNWGQAAVESNMLSFHVDQRPTFQIPLAEVTNCTLQNKTELALEFRPSDQQHPVDPMEDTLVEMRFYVPNTTATAAEGEEEEEEQPADNDASTTAAEQLELLIKQRAQIGIVAGDCYASFSEVPFLTPRGRYTLDLFPTFVRMHGKTYDYKIPYDTLLRLFLLPKPDEQHVLLVLGLDPPLRQGQTRYPFLVAQFLREDDRLDLDLACSDAAFSALQSAHPALQREYRDAPTFDVLSTLLRALSNRPVVIPGQFRSRAGHPALKCSIKASDGSLYLLDKSFLFIPKPTVFLRYVDVAHMETSRLDVNAASSGSASRSFDLKIHMKSGLEYQFSNIAREEYQLLRDFMDSKQLPLASEKKPATHRVDIELDDSSDEEEEGDKKKKKRRDDEDDDEDDEEEEDEDFNPDEDEDEVGEEYDEDYESDEDEGEEEKEGKGEKKKKKEDDEEEEEEEEKEE